MTTLRSSDPADPPPIGPLGVIEAAKADAAVGLVEISEVADEPVASDLSSAEALIRMHEAEDTLRAIGAGEVDAFVVSNSGAGEHVFTLHTADRPYRMFVENMREGAATVSDDGTILYANRYLAELLSCSTAQLVGSPLARVLAGPDLVMLGEGGLGRTLKLDLVTSSGGFVPVLVGTSPLDLGETVVTCLTFSDLSALKVQEREIARLMAIQSERLTELQRAQGELTHQATHDALTALPNRALLFDRIEQVLAHSRRSGQANAVLFLDLDRFKSVNDANGHIGGDVVLRRVASKLLSLVRSIDTVARVGGDEFVILLAQVDSQVHAVDVAARIVRELARRPESADDGERITASIGLSVSIGGRGSAEDLVREADTAMYQAKSRGGNRVDVFDSVLGRQIVDRSRAQARLQSAIDESRIIAHYQPIIDLPSGAIVGFEALARLVDRDGTILSPPAFIAVAEDTGLVVQLGEQMLELACHEATRWSEGGARGHAPCDDRGRLTVAVNLSARQFRPGNLSAVVEGALRRSGLDPACLHLELTETAIMGLDPEILNQLTLIRDLGVQIGLDDFGTGYASLTHLRRLPLTFVKIDLSFVQGLGADQEDERIVSAVVDLTSKLGLRSIAEGVETDDQLRRLRELDCDQAQGYLFVRPHPPEAVAETMLHANW